MHTYPVPQNRRKIDFLSEACIKQNIKIIIALESHLKGEIKDEEIKIAGFNIHRCDRPDIRQGGIIIYIHESLEVSEPITSFSNNTCELLALKVNDINTLYHLPV